jgi:hypothetical protein
MQASTTRHEPRPANSEKRGVVYRTICQNPGCGHTFELRITPENAGLLSGMIACPHCHRHGGILKPQGRLADKLFGAKLVFRMTGVAPRMDDDEMLSEGELRY